MSNTVTAVLVFAAVAASAGIGEQTRTFSNLESCQIDLGFFRLCW